MWHDGYKLRQEHHTVLCTCAHPQSTWTTLTLTLLYIALMASPVCEALQRWKKCQNWHRLYNRNAPWFLHESLQPRVHVRPRCWVETDRWRLEIALKHFLALIPWGSPGMFHELHDPLVSTNDANPVESCPFFAVHDLRSLDIACSFWHALVASDPLA